MRIITLGLTVTLLVITGCASNGTGLSKVAEPTRHNVFSEVLESKAASGKALMNIDFPVKNFKARILNNYIKHSDPPYTVTIYIDGQPVVLSDEPVLENLPGDFKENPEVGTGWKYNFHKTLLLDPGKHLIAIAVPLSGVAVEKDLTLQAGENNLKLTPKYNSPITRYSNYPRFSRGLKEVAVELIHKDFNRS